MTWIQRLFARNISAYLVLALLLTWAVDHAKVQDQRSRYLLGIYYNGHFKNKKDGIVYFDYMHRQDPKNPAYSAGLAECYRHLESK